MLSYVNPITEMQTQCSSSILWHGLFSCFSETNLMSCCRLLLPCGTAILLVEFSSFLLNYYDVNPIV